MNWRNGLGLLVALDRLLFVSFILDLGAVGALVNNPHMQSPWPHVV